MIRTAAMNYLLNSGVQWGSAPAVKVMFDDFIIGYFLFYSFQTDGIE